MSRPAEAFMTGRSIQKEAFLMENKIMETAKKRACRMFVMRQALSHCAPGGARF